VSSGDFILETYNADFAATGTPPTATATRTISAPLVLRGNLLVREQTNLGTALLSTYAGATTTIQFSAPATFGISDDATHTFIIDAYGSNGSNRAYPYTSIIFEKDVSGYANIVQTGYGIIYYEGSNADYHGNYTWHNGGIYARSDSVFGTGTVTIGPYQNGGLHLTKLFNSNGTALTTPALDVPNQFLFVGIGFGTTGPFNFSLDSRPVVEGGTGLKSYVGAQINPETQTPYATATDIFHMSFNSSSISTFGINHIIEGPGTFQFGANGSYSLAAKLRFLGAGEWTGGININGSSVNVNTSVQAGRDSVWNSDHTALVSGAFGTGTITFSAPGTIGAYVGPDSVPNANPDAPTITISNPIVITTPIFYVNNDNGFPDQSTNKPTLIFDTTEQIALRSGKGALAIYTYPNNTLRIEAKLIDRKSVV
jgi:hypothetical protein